MYETDMVELQRTDGKGYVGELCIKHMKELVLVVNK
jgi:hypothetical protein